MNWRQYEIGMVGLGAMGRNFVLSIADHGYAVAGYDKDQPKVELLRKESAERIIHAVANTMPRWNGHQHDNKYPATHETCGIAMTERISNMKPNADHPKAPGSMPGSKAHFFKILNLIVGGSWYPKK